MERKIDEVFVDPKTQIELKCIESSNGCKGCFYDIKREGHCRNHVCAYDERSDKRDVVFIIN